MASAANNRYTKVKHCYKTVTTSAHNQLQNKRENIRRNRKSGGFMSTYKAIILCIAMFCCTVAVETDAIVTWKNKKAYIFKGSEYIRWDINSGDIDRGYPKSIGRGWPGLWDNLDAAVNGSNGKIYFFKGTKYIRWDIKKDQMDAGYPKQIKKGWPGLWNQVDAAVNWGNGKIYFFKGSEYIR